MNYCYFLLLSLLLLDSGIACTSSCISKSPLNKIPDSAFWVQNHWPISDECSAPHQWRSAKTLSTITAPSINKQGLDNLMISGSSPLTVNNMYWLKKHYGTKQPIYIIDLRQETHLYINNLPISLFYQRDQINWGKSIEYINKAEQFWTNKLANKGSIILNQLGKPQKQIKVPESPTYTRIYKAQTEAELVKQNGFAYFRIAVPDYLPPSPAQVDDFLLIMKNRPVRSWIHFHCAGGKGRTTTFMVMSDILLNGSKVDLKNIILRQAQHGGINLLGQSKSIQTQAWKKQYHLARENFIHLFYQYVQSSMYPAQSFSQWISNQPSNDYKLILKTNSYYSEPCI